MPPLDNPTQADNETQLPGATVVSAPEPDDDGGDDGGGDQEQAARAEAGLQSPLGGQQRPAKAGGRAERRRIWEANERLRGELGAANGRIEQLTQTFSQQMRELREAITGPGRGQSAAAQDGQAAPQNQRLASLQRARQAELAAFQNHDPRTGKYDLTRYNEIEEELRAAQTEAHFEKFLQARGIDLNQRQARVDPEALASEATMRQIRNQLVQEVPWLRVAGATGDEARQKMGRTLAYLLDMGRQNTIETHREAAAMVERQLGLTPRRAPTPNVRRYSDVGDDNRAQGGAGRRSVTVPNEMLEGTGLPPERLRAALFRGRQ